MARGCTHCLLEIPTAARRCPHCTQNFSDEEVAAALAEESRDTIIKGAIFASVLLFVLYQCAR